MLHPKMERMSDESLCELAGEDLEAQNCLFTRHIDSVTHFLMRNYQGIEHEAVAAEVITDALAYVSKHGVSQSFRALLRRVANQYGWKAKQSAARRYQHETGFDEAISQGRALCAVEQPVLAELALAQALQKLTASERDALLLRYVEQRSEAEIASFHSKSVTAVKSSLYHARQKLRADQNFAALYYQERKKTMQGWYLAGGRPQNYDFGVTLDFPKMGHKSAYLKSKKGVQEGFGTLMQNFAPDKYIGKRVRFTGDLKSKDLANMASLWLRIDGPTKERPLRFDNMSDRPLRGSSGWRHCEIVLDVPPESVGIALGILLSTSGEVWATNLKFEEVGKDVPLTTTQKELPSEPQNLGFEC